MLSQKQRENLKTIILVPAYHRPEYTFKCIQALEQAQEYKNVDFLLVDDGSLDSTDIIFNKSTLSKEVVVNPVNKGLRSVLIDFISKAKEYDIMGVIGNDCVVPKNWLNDLIDIFAKTDVQILSPNVYPSNAAFKYGKEAGLPYMPSDIVGGLWFMYTDLIKDMTFEKHEVSGITGAFNVLKQVLIEKSPKVGWASKVAVQDIGHWSGRHPEHIKSQSHLDYYQEVGRKVDF